ncbi:DUF6933 domain-containing protein [Mariniflexile jejuense]|uniref:DUF6933 domain-containing protein n=1 Tax=Mariniflexile jejuense TaxID=1173582 RepID=A0ABW3JLP9_9FLAO
MHSVYCTKKLQSFIKEVEEKLPANLSEISLSDWNAHLFFIEKRKCIIFINNITFYSVFLTDILKKDLKTIDIIFKERLKEQLIHDKIIETDESTESIFPGMKLKFYRTNNNKKVIGRINDFVDMFKIHCSYKYENFNEMNIIHENGLINGTPTGKLLELKKSWSSPIKNVKEIIKTSA